MRSSGGKLGGRAGSPDETATACRTFSRKAFCCISLPCEQIPLHSRPSFVSLSPRPAKTSLPPSSLRLARRSLSAIRLFKTNHTAHVTEGCVRKHQDVGGKHHKAARRPRARRGGRRPARTTTPTTTATTTTTTATTGGHPRRWRLRREARQRQLRRSARRRKRRRGGGRLAAA